MAKSRIGLDFDAALEDDGPTGPQPQGMDAWSDGDVDEAGEDEENGGDGDDGDDDSDDGMFTSEALKSVRPTGGSPTLKKAPSGLGASMGRSVLQQAVDTGFDMGGFLMGGGSEGLGADDGSPQRPPLVNLPASEFRPGTEVWVADPNDVITIMHAHWEPAMEHVCAGRVKGTVRRVSGDQIIVEFPASDAIGASTTVFTFPRACLFKEPVEPYDVTFDASTSKHISGGGGLGPRAGHDKKVPEPKFGILAPVDAAGTIGTPDRVISAVIDALRDGDADAAEEVISKAYAAARQRRGVPDDAPAQPEDEDFLDASAIRGSRALIAMAQGDLVAAEAACDPLRAMQSDSITMCLRAWHVKLMAGSFAAATDLLNHAHLLCPHEPIIPRLLAVTGSLRRHDAALRAAHAPVAIAASYRLERRAIAKRYFVPGDVIAQDELLFSMPAMDSATDVLCASCNARKPTHTDARAPAYRFCGAACFDAAWRDFLEFEEKTYAFSVRSARSMLAMRRGSEHYKDEEAPLMESAYAAIRVWARVIAAVTRRVGDKLNAQEPAGPAAPSSSTDIDAVVFEEADRVGVAPIPDGVVFRCVSTKVEYQTKALHAVLAARLPDRLKEVFDFSFFRDLLAAVHTYRKRLDWPLAPEDPETRTIELSVITRASGRVPVYEPPPAAAEAMLHVGDGDQVFLVARAVIDPRAELVVL